MEKKLSFNENADNYDRLRPGIVRSYLQILPHMPG